ncbi:hypothetical protein RRF57_005905 [Xylaria bambusicola]|uniref:Uncharacterized protein n=1 Tax=Xylaria bambusicola TaxID=326684 RepID=A0AAN7UDE6_9PEZI
MTECDIAWYSWYLLAPPGVPPPVADKDGWTGSGRGTPIPIVMHKKGYGPGGTGVPEIHGPGIAVRRQPLQST